MVNAGYFWRAILHRRIIACLENVLQRSIYSEVLSDLPHNRLEQTERGFLHAKGVQRLEYGFPMVVCGDLGGRSALMLPNLPERTAFGCCHGRARHPQLRAFKIPPTPRAPWTNHPQSLPSTFQQRLLEQNLDDAVNSMTAQGATSLLASLLPVLNFRGDPKHHVQQLASTYLPTHGEQKFTQAGERR